jgi:biotin-(acetyl-CoA carboxylase) ligase
MAVVVVVAIMLGRSKRGTTGRRRRRGRWWRGRRRMGSHCSLVRRDAFDVSHAGFFLVVVVITVAMMVG